MPFKSFFALRCEGERDSIRRTRRLIVDHVEIVVVNAGVDHFLTDILERMFDDQFGFVAARRTTFL